MPDSESSAETFTAPPSKEAIASLTGPWPSEEWSASIPSAAPLNSAALSCEHPSSCNPKPSLFTRDADPAGAYPPPPAMCIAVVRLLRQAAAAIASAEARAEGTKTPRRVHRTSRRSGAEAGRKVHEEEAAAPRSCSIGKPHFGDWRR